MPGLNHHHGHCVPRPWQLNHHQGEPMALPMPSLPWQHPHGWSCEMGSAPSLLLPRQPTQPQPVLSVLEQCRSLQDRTALQGRAAGMGWPPLAALLQAEELLQCRGCEWRAGAKLQQPLRASPERALSQGEAGHRLPLGGRRGLSMVVHGCPWFSILLQALLAGGGGAVFPPGEAISDKTNKSFQLP